MITLFQRERMICVFQNPIWIKITSVFALVLFVLALVLGIGLTSASLSGVEYFFTPDNYTYEPISSEDPGAGWLILFQSFGGATAGLLSAFAAAVGIICIFGSIIIYIPALVAWIVYKVSKSVAAYWTLMGVWLVFWIIAIILIILG